MRYAGAEHPVGGNIVLPVALLFVFGLFSGCFGAGGQGANANDPTATRSGSSTTTNTQPPPPPATFAIDLLLSFAFNGCRGATAMTSVPTAEAQAMLPEGFTVAPSPFGEPGRSALAVDIFSCNNLTTPNAAVPATWYGQAYTFVERPTERVAAAPEADVHEYLFRTLAGRDVLFDLWRAAGYDAYSGDPALGWTQPVTTPTLLPAVAVDIAIGNYTMAVQAGPPAFTPSGVAATFARYTVLGDESVLVWTGTYDLPTTYSGQAVWQVDNGDAFGRFRNASGRLQGFALLYDGGAMTGMDLRRYFQPAA